MQKLDSLLAILGSLDKFLVKQFFIKSLHVHLIVCRIAKHQNKEKLK